MNEANHRAFARLEAPAQVRDPALIAAMKYQIVYRDYKDLIAREGHLLDSKKLDRTHERWARALAKALESIPTSWQGVLALLDICTDEGSIGEGLGDLKSGVQSISSGVRRLLVCEFKAV